jgi:predicted ABC-type ATPase
VDRSESFAFETTLSGLTYARHIQDWREAGYHVKLIFLRLPTVELALARIRMRVAQGGHDVSETIVRRRFTAGLKNFRNIYQKIANIWLLYDNSGQQPRLLEMGQNT